MHQCTVLKSRAPKSFDFTPLFSASEQGTIIGIAGRADSSCTGRQGNRMQTGRGKRKKSVQRDREEEWGGDKNRKQN